MTATTEANGRPRVVIVGGGFGGFFSALRLERRRGGGPPAHVTLISDANALLYTPFLPQAAGGTLEPRHVTVPLRGALRSTEILVGRAVGHDPEQRTIEFAAASDERRTLHYDHLIMSPGSSSKMLPVPGLAGAAVGFKTLAEAIHLRNTALQMLELANTTADSDERTAQMTFVFVGGGYAGVEALAELEDLLREARTLYPTLRDQPLRWVLVEATESLLPEVGTRLSAYVMRQLHGRGIELRLGTRVREVDDGVVVLDTGERVPARTVVLTAGVRAHPTVQAMGLPTADSGRVKVDDTLAVEGLPGVWALGDAAAVPDPARPGLTCPPTSQHVTKQAGLVADNVLASIAGQPAESFRYRTRGLFVDLGRYKAVASITGLQFSGLLAWFMARSYHLSQIPGLAHKARVATDWTVGILFDRDLSELGSLGHPEPLDPKGEEHGRD
ncbi:MAG: NAD(P)/FAD-dependent oxidoreductase [Miltoncostaeaceae bacterium]